MKMINIIQEDELPKKVREILVTKDMINQYKDNGYVLCYSENGELKEFTTPTSKTFDAKTRTIYAIPMDKFETVSKLSENIKEFISLHQEKIELYKKYVPAALQKLTN
jgi:hypothetical protein